MQCRHHGGACREAVVHDDDYAPRRVDRRSPGLRYIILASAFRRFAPGQTPMVSSVLWSSSMRDLWLTLQLIFLLAAANIAPIAAKRVMGNRWAWPLDGGLKLRDGRPFLGSSKTVRGVVAAIAACTLCALLLGLPAMAGASIGVGAMAGDAVSSFIKRRLAIEPSGQAFGIDQIPESLLPLLAAKCVLDVSLLQVVAITTAFVLLEIPLARLAYHLGLRDQPY